MSEERKYTLFILEGKPEPGDIIYCIGPTMKEELGVYVDHITWFNSINREPKLLGWYPKHWRHAEPEIAAQYKELLQPQQKKQKPERVVVEGEKVRKPWTKKDPEQAAKDKAWRIQNELKKKLKAQQV